ncbi:MAG: alpha/beta hydrolase fold domain-containing protein [Acidimicrobiia bacterium]
MSLWPEEYEAFRAEAREMAVKLAAAFAAFVGDAVPRDFNERLALQRKMVKAMETTSPHGRDEVIGGVPCRTFRVGGAPGVYLHFHGGAMMLGSPRAQDVALGELSRRLGVSVVSVDYRLAPEHPFPAGGDDCFAVARDVLATHEGPLVLGGESAGAYYAALTVLRIRDELNAADRVSGVNLTFGVYDLSGTPSHHGVRPSEAPDVVGPQTFADVLEGYTPGMSALDVRRPDISPMYAALHGLPPALFSVGSADHLLDDSLFMARRWEAWGNEAELAVYPDCPHAFIGHPTELSKRAAARIDEFIARCSSPK